MLSACHLPKTIFVEPDWIGAVSRIQDSLFRLGIGLIKHNDLRGAGKVVAAEARLHLTVKSIRREWPRRLIATSQMRGDRRWVN